MTGAGPGGNAGPATSAPRPAVDDPALYTARVRNTGGTDGEVRSADGPAALRRLPTGAPSDPSRGFTPEHFVAMAWSTCLGETLRVALRERGERRESSVEVEVALHRAPAGGYRFVPRAAARIEGLPAAAAQELVDAAHARCPVSRLLRGTQDPQVVVLDGVGGDETPT